MKHSRENIIKKLQSFGRVLLNEPMSGYTTFKTGGPADLLILPDSHKSINEIAAIIIENSIALTVIGGGSNLLIGDKGIRGAVLLLKNENAEYGTIRMTENGTIYAESTVKKNDFIDYTIKNGFEGMEFMAGIPGSMGGGIVMNAGTDKGSFVDILESIIYINSSGVIIEKNITKDMTGYRSLRIQDLYIVLSGKFRLKKSDGIDNTRKKIDAILKDRESKHPLDYPCAGSAFKNPEGYSSWKLIDDAGLKGKRIGGAMVSELHTNFIINYDNAASEDILDLINHVKEKVYTAFDIVLEPEIRIIGDF